MRERNLAETIAGLCGARKRCIAANNTDWERNHTAELLRIGDELLPSGSGIDCGTTIDLDASSDEKIVLACEYHHTNDVGYYDGWSSHRITITPSFMGLNIKISGRDRNLIKDYLYEVYRYCLTQPYQEPSRCDS